LAPRYRGNWGLIGYVLSYSKLNVAGEVLKLFLSSFLGEIKLKQLAGMITILACNIRN